MTHRRAVRRSGVALAVVTSAVTLTSTASAHMPKTITIRHQVRGCHVWSFANGPYRASLKVRLDRDTSLVFVNNDMMPHRLLQVAGPKAHLYTARMNHMGAKATLTFTRAGVYRFMTRAGEDYPSMGPVKTLGRDNVLRLTVTVT